MSSREQECSTSPAPLLSLVYKARAAAAARALAFLHLQIAAALLLRPQIPSNLSLNFPAFSEFLPKAVMAVT